MQQRIKLYVAIERCCVVRGCGVKCWNSEFAKCRQIIAVWRSRARSIHRPSVREGSWPQDSRSFRMRNTPGCTLSLGSRAPLAIQTIHQKR